MNLNRILAVLALVLASLTTLGAAPRHVWTDTAGRKLEADFIRLDGNMVHLQTAAGVLFSLSIERLSAPDQQYAKTQPAVAPESLLSPLAEGATVAAAAARIDQLVDLGIQKENLRRASAAKSGNESRPTTPIKPNEDLSDDLFVRRIYLDIAGRIPNYDEAVRFTRSTDPERRRKLIDQLLASDGYVSNAYNYFADMLRLKDDFGRNLVRGTSYIQWVKDSLRNSRPYDQMVKELLTAKGTMWANGAAGYILRDTGMPLDNLSYTLQVFLGTDVACAQCHDHPFADWTQRQFYEMAAFFGKTTTEMGPKDFVNGDPSERLINEAVGMVSGTTADTVRGLVSELISANRFAVCEVDENRMRLPEDYRYADAKPGDPVNPKLIRWSDADPKNPAYEVEKALTLQNKGISPREIFADWLTHPKNPRFAMTIGNRLWSRAFGKGLTPSVRNVDNPQEAYNPELLMHLANEMVRLRFDLKEFQRILYNTRTYQRVATMEELPMGEPYYFQGPILRRMTSEQAWDSYMTLLLGEPDKFKNSFSDLYQRSMDINLNKVDARTLLMKASALSSIAGRQQAGMGAMLTEAGGKAPTEKVIVYEGMKLMRASELEQPAPDGHFLREFGQSERFTVDGGSKDGSAPQVLMMMNGLAQKMLTSKDSLIARNMEKVKGPPEKVEVVFLSILGRHPTFREKDIARRVFAAEGEAAYANMIWALINAREFCFVQ